MGGPSISIVYDTSERKTKNRYDVCVTDEGCDEDACPNSDN